MRGVGATFCIDTAVLADIAAMHSLRLAVRENRLSNPARVTEESYVRYVEAGSAWVAVGAERLVFGFAILDERDASVWALFVHPDHEGAGIGRALHGALLDWARRHGMSGLSLTTAPRHACRAILPECGLDQGRAIGFRRGPFRTIAVLKSA